MTAGVDSASKFRDGDFSNIWLSRKSHYQFTTARDRKNTSQHCCDKTMDVKMAIYRECCFPNCKNHGEKGYLCTI